MNKTKLKFKGHCTIEYDINGCPYFYDKDFVKHYLDDFMMSGLFPFHGYSGQSYFSDYRIILSKDCFSLKCYYATY